MSPGGETNCFSSCFALYVYDLFGLVGDLPPATRQEWIDHLNSYQCADSGLYVPRNYAGSLESKTVHQLTTFCLSGLRILDGEPRHHLRFLERWQTPEGVESYLRRSGCFAGVAGSGNTAMFVAIFLTYQHEVLGDPTAKELIETWFSTHDRHQSASGCWGDHHLAFQNAFHQFVIYNYWRRDIRFSERVVDHVLSLQDRRGRFAPYPGGGACWDYDAVDILVHLGIRKNYRMDKVACALQTLRRDILASQNSDGGFCETRMRPHGAAGIIRSVPFVISTLSARTQYYRLRHVLSLARNSRQTWHPHWLKSGIPWHVSDLWNTWFRCLAVAEIERSLGGDAPKDSWRFQKFVGLGYYPLVEGTN